MLHVTKVSAISLSYLTLGGFVVAFSMISLLAKEKLYIGEVVLGTGFGVIIGPYCAGIFDPRSWGSTTVEQNKITLEIMRVVLATGLFAIGVELPKAYLAEHARSLLVMVVPTMAFGWLVSAGIIHALFPALTFVSSLAISACLTPTDPILAAAIIGGKFAIKNVPGHVRRILSAESAANDGLAYPFLSISIYLAVESSKKAAFGKWFLIGWLYQVILGTVLGTVLGLAFSFLMKISHRKGLIDRESFVAQYLALAIFTIGVASTIGTDDLLATFAAGSAISWDGHFNKHTEDEVFSSVLDLVLNCACFIYIGAWLPFDKFQALEPWRLIVLFLAILVLRRIPSLLALYKFIPDVHNWREALFCGHFGPMGVGAIFISTLALTELPVPSDPPADQNELLAASLHPIVSFVVLCSIVIHGLSIPAFWFGRKLHSRTVSLSATWTRTWTSRGGAGSELQPDWLLSARRAPDTQISDPLSPDGREFAGSGANSPGELERGVGLRKGTISRMSEESTRKNDNPIVGSALSTEGLERSLKSRPDTPHHDFRVGGQAAVPLESEPSSLSSDERVWTKNGKDKKEANNGHEVHEEDYSKGVVGFGFASLHDTQENDESRARERMERDSEAKDTTEMRDHGLFSGLRAGKERVSSVGGLGTAPDHPVDEDGLEQASGTVTKQVQFAQ